jgi:hypothetical protein
MRKTLNDAQSKLLNEAVRLPILHAMGDQSVELNHFATMVPFDMAALLVKVGYIHIGICNKHKMRVEYVALTDRGRRALGFALYGVEDALLQAI